MPRNSSSKDGIALIIVLGLLSVLVILAVAFAVSMRTERLAASNYADVVRAKHLVDVGIARALKDIDDYCFTSPYVLTMTNAAFVSIDAGDQVPDIISGEATNFVPDSLFDDVLDTSAQTEWIDVTDPDTGEILGRVAYIAVNCSGFLDANRVAKLPADHTDGNFPADIDIVATPDVTDATLFIDSRTNTMVRFETYPELVEYLGGVQSPVSNFFHYSRFREERRWAAAPGPQVTDKSDINALCDDAIGGSTAVLEQELEDAGIPGAISQNVAWNLLDFYDSDFIPDGGGHAIGATVNNFMTEPVPMFNEIAISNYVKVVSLGGGTNQWTHGVVFNFETWYPFPIMVGIPEMEIVVNPPAFTMGPPPFNAFVPPAPKDVTVVSGHSFQLTEMTWEAVATVPPTTVPFGMGGKVTFEGAELRVKGSGTVLDTIPALPEVTVFVTQLAALGPGDSKSSLAQGYSCNDPRFNWDSSHWVSTLRSLGTTNAVVTGVEGPSGMFVRNGPLESISEMGFLSIGAPWSTIRLYDLPSGELLHPVLDYFRAGPYTGLHTNGLVNLNSIQPDPISAVFYNVPIQRFPGESTTRQVASAAARDAGAAIVAATKAVGTDNFKNISEIGTVPEVVLDSNADSDARRESIIANTVPLLNVRGNVFSIIVIAQAVNDTGSSGDPAGGPSLTVEDNEVVAEQRALAVVWRDPYPRDTADYEFPFVRFFKYLTD